MPDVKARSYVSHGAGRDAEPYGYFVLPPSPYEPDHSGFPTPQTIAANSTWRLATDEAIVVLGCTPPEARYFGLTGYVVGACAQAADEKFTTYR